MNLQATQSEKRPAAGATADDADRSRAMRFTYASGSKPLVGYTIKRGIGRGGFGEVYYAVSDGGKEVALKLIRRNFDIELRGVAHCLNLKHPNLLGLYDVRTDDHDDHWVVMEYVTGQSLEDMIAAHPDGMPEDEANAWMHGIAAGVGYLHECGIVHRDLKPGNIFSDQGLVKIGDYGLSKFISCSRRSGQTESVGTVHYMAPEIANGRYGKEIDIYAVGVMFYEMLTGRVPFEGESVGEVLMKHLTAEPDVSALSEPYRSIVRRCLAKDPDLRYRNVQELLADLPAPDLATSRVHRQPKVASGQPVAAAAAASAAATPIDAEVINEPVRPNAGPPSPPLPVNGVPEEPVWRWVKQTFSEIGYAWNNTLNTPTKVILIIVGVWVLIVAGAVIIPGSMILVFAYLVYRAIWTIVTWHSREAQRKSRAAKHAVARSHEPVTRPAPTRHRERSSRRLRWRSSKLSRTLPKKPVRQQLTELSATLVYSALVCLVVSVIMMLFPKSQSPEQYAWLALTGIVGSWCVIIPGKIWEGAEVETAQRRFWMLVLGLGVGAIAYAFQTSLFVSLPHEFNDPIIRHRSYNVTAEHTVMTNLCYFGLLFLFVRWWRLTDPLRPTRVSLWTTAVCMTWAGAIFYMLRPFQSSWAVFPQPWGFMLAATIAIAVQLSSPWLSPRQRQEMQLT